MSSFEGVLSPAQKTLIRAWWKKVTVANPNKQGNDDLRDRAKNVFGLPLSESIKYAHSSISYQDERNGQRCYGVIPTIVAKCGSFLKEEGLLVEGIFRMSGSAKRIGMLQQIFDSDHDFGAKFDWSSGGYTVHDAANVMRRFLNHLPEPVITLDYYRPFKDTMQEEFPTIDAKIDAFQNLIECLPLVHQYLLLYIMDLLGLFAMTSDTTRMDIPALAAVFAPGVLSHPDDELNPVGYKESQRVLEFLIQHQDKFSVPRSCLQQNQSLISRDEFNAAKSSSLRRKDSASAFSTRRPQRRRSSSFSKAALSLHNFDLGSISTPQLQRSSTMHSSVAQAYKAELQRQSSSSSSFSSIPTKSNQLRRSNTAPSKRNNGGTIGKSQLPEFPASLHTNGNAHNVKAAAAGRWKSIRRVPSSSRA
ncbi:Rho GTPase activation protein [Syncephalastrum racemosum]|uniref:Rho GTPase activation protein n=1 Tax=Syncephalastrum racemosum TaxID=13706 RepID=A0A1X2HRY2_SYNRA|nr:Rho GTPase activation protein [Syncephalastrum racemosum]